MSPPAKHIQPLSRPLTLQIRGTAVQAFPLILCIAKKETVKIGGVFRRAASERRKKMAHGVSRGAASVRKTPGRGERKSALKGPPHLSPLWGFDERFRGAAPGLPPWATICRPSGATTRGVAFLCRHPRYPVEQLIVICEFEICFHICGDRLLLNHPSKQRRRQDAKESLKGGKEKFVLFGFCLRAFASSLLSTVSRGSVVGAEDAGEDGFLDFPDQGHGDGHGQEDEEQQDPLASRLDQAEKDADGQGRVPDFGEGEVDGEEGGNQDQENTVQGGEDAGFLAQRFVGEHGAEAFQDQVEVEQKQEGGKGHDGDGVVEEGDVRQMLMPVEEGRQADVDQAEDLGAVQGQDPDALLFLEIGHQPQTVEEQGRDGDGGDQPVMAEGIEPAGVGSLHADDEGDGQSPKQGGKAAHQPAERPHQFVPWRGLGNARVAAQKVRYVYSFRPRSYSSSRRMASEGLSLSDLMATSIWAFICRFNSFSSYCTADRVWMMVLPSMTSST